MNVSSVIRRGKIQVSQPIGWRDGLRATSSVRWKTRMALKNRKQPRVHQYDFLSPLVQHENQDRQLLAAGHASRLFHFRFFSFFFFSFLFSLFSFHSSIVVSPRVSFIVVRLHRYTLAVPLERFKETHHRRPPLPVPPSAMRIAVI